MPLYDFRCSNGHVNEALRPPGQQTIACPLCHELASRIYSRPAAVGHQEWDTRGMFRRFSEASQELEHQGYAGPSPWRAAKDLARRMEAAGENPVAERTH